MHSALQTFLSLAFLNVRKLQFQIQMVLLETLYALCPAIISLTIAFINKETLISNSNGFAEHLVCILTCKHFSRQHFKREETLVSNSNGFTGDLICTLPCKHFAHYSIFKCKNFKFKRLQWRSEKFCIYNIHDVFLLLEAIVLNLLLQKDGTDIQKPYEISARIV